MLGLLASEFRLVAQDVIAFTLIAIAFVWGGGPERAAAAVWLVIFEFGGLLKEAVWGPDLLLSELNLYLATEDFLAGGLWITIAIFANRNYTLCIAAMQILAMSAHVARGLVESISPVAYVVMTVGPGWFQLLFLGIGLTRHIRRKQKHGSYRDWRAIRGLPPGKVRDFGQKLLAILSHDFFANRGARQ